MYDVLEYIIIKSLILFSFFYFLVFLDLVWAFQRVDQVQITLNEQSVFRIELYLPCGGSRPGTARDLSKERRFI